MTHVDICRFCGKPGPANHQPHQECRLADFADRFTELIESGVGWGQIVDSFGIKPFSIEKSLKRAKRPDLMMAWRSQFRDGGSYETPGWLAQDRIHSANWQRRGEKVSA